MTALAQVPDWTVLAAFGFGPLDPTPIWTDITASMVSYDFADGRQHELDRVEAGNLSLILNCNFGEFVPGNKLSPYWNLLDPWDALGLPVAAGGTWAASGGGSYTSQTSESIWGSEGGLFTGSGSAAVTATTATGTAGYAVTGLHQYTASVWLLANGTAESMSVGISWYTSGGSLISSSAGTAANDSTSIWTQYLCTGAAPSNAAFAAVTIAHAAHTTHSHFVSCPMLSYNPPVMPGFPSGVPIGWNQGQYGPTVPCTPIWVKGDYSSTLYPNCYTFADAWEPVPKNPVRQDCTLTAYDILGLLAQVPLSNSLLFPDEILGVGGIINYWRLNDAIGSASAASYTAGGPLIPYSASSDVIAPDFGSQDTTGAGLTALLSSSFTGSGSGALLYDTATAVTFNTPASGVSTQILALPAGQSLLSDGDPWSMTMLVNFGTNPGASLFNTFTSSGNGMYLTVEDGSVFTGFSGRIVLWTDGGATHTISTVGVLDNQWHLLTITSAGIGNPVYLVLDETIIAISPNLSTSSSPVGGGGASNPAFQFTNESYNTADTPETSLQDVCLYDFALPGGTSDAIWETFHLLQDVELTGQRLAKVLRIAGYESFPQSIDGGTILCQAETTSQTSTASLDYMQTISDTELGFLWQDENGVIQYKDALYPLTNADSFTPVGTLGDNLAADMFYRAGVKVPQDSQDLYTDIQVQANQNAGAGVMQEVIVNAAVGPPGGFGKRVLQRTGLLFAYDFQALNQANLLAERYATPQKRVDGVKLNGADGAGANLPFMLGNGLWDQLTFQRQGPGESPFSAGMLIEHRKFSWKADPGNFEVEYILSPYEVVSNGLDYQATGTTLAGGTPPSAGPFYVQAGADAFTFSGGTSPTHSFPVHFPNGLISVRCTFADPGVPADFFINIGAAGTAGFGLHANNLSSAFNGTALIQWVAIGW